MSFGFNTPDQGLISVEIYKEIINDKSDEVMIGCDLRRSDQYGYDMYCSNSIGDGGIDIYIYIYHCHNTDLVEFSIP